MSLLNTTNPIALQVLMSETIFGMDFPENHTEHTQENRIKENEPIVAANNPEVTIKSLGDNRKNILFIVDNDENDFFSRDAELAFVKTLNALKLDLEDVSIINYKKLTSALTFDQIKMEFAPKACILLGLDPKRLGLNNCAENILANENGIQFLNSFSFEEMLNDTAKKRMFWDTIKIMNF